MIDFSIPELAAIVALIDCTKEDNEALVKYFEAVKNQKGKEFAEKFIQTVAGLEEKCQLQLKTLRND